MVYGGSLPKATCADCISLNSEERDSKGRILGLCLFRPELGRIPSDMPACNVFKIRKSRDGKVGPPSNLKTNKITKPTVIKRHIASDINRTIPNKNNPSTKKIYGDINGEIDMDRDGLKQIFRELLEEETLYGYVDMGNRWQGGMMILQPADPEHQAKEIPLESFFHKIVMIRDRLRVLEAKINAHDKLPDFDKVELQQYISKIYGSLTTFNILFKNKEDNFSSTDK